MHGGATARLPLESCFARRFRVPQVLVQEAIHMEVLLNLNEPLLQPRMRSSCAPRVRFALVAAFGLGALAALICSSSSHGPSTIAADALPPLLVEVWETAAGGHKLEQVPLRSGAVAAKADASLTVWPDEEYQSIVGFGGALTQASGTVWHKLSPRQRARVVELFFGESGIQASLARIPINSCDFAEASYSLDDVPGDYALSHFDESMPDDEQLLLPLVRAAIAAGGDNLQLLASPWSPPAWMKSNGDMNGNGKPGGLKPEAAAAWAAYLSRWLGAISAHGANVTWLTVQNEPLAPSPWEACYYDAASEATFVGTHLGPALAAGAAAGRHPPVALLGFDDQKDAILPWSRALLDADSPAAPYTAGIAYHWYAGDHSYQLGPTLTEQPQPQHRPRPRPRP